MGRQADEKLPKTKARGVAPPSHDPRRSSSFARPFTTGARWGRLFPESPMSD